MGSDPFFTKDCYALVESYGFRYRWAPFRSEMCFQHIVLLNDFKVERLCW